jgi:prepilin-type N-terminal cleavage/methylation domain-containing protein
VSSPESRSLARKSASSRKSAFTLPELLTVITISALLMMATFGAISRARVMARRAKCEAQLRQLVSAWEQYYSTYGKWPRRVDGRTVDTTVSNLRPIFDAKDADNEYGVVFLNFTGTEDFKDPWGTPYRLTFDSVRSTGSQDRNKTAFETTVALPVRETLNP